uniref:Uncharacterized protein n=1 Tax=Esox lucius TaxID=8010 RepID=A0AAY5KC46_ESOLU
MEEQERTLTSQEDAEESTPGGLMTTEEEAKLLPNDPDITKTLQEPYGSTPEYIKAKPQSSEETLPQTQSQIETQSQTLTESNRLSQTEQQALSQTETQMLSQTETHTLTDTQTQSQIETQSQTLTESNRLSQTEQQTLSQTETHTLTDTQTLSQTQRQTEEFLILDQNGQSLHYEHMVIVSGQSDNGEMFVIPSTQLGGSHVLLPRGQLLDIMESSGSSGEKTGGDDQEEELQDNTLTTVSDDLTAVTSDAKTQTQSCQDCFTSPLKPLPSNAPNWALRLRNAEKIGDSYRGYCNTDTELETILWLHKQQTNSVFGTRQSPSPAKPATRLMWKSQYVPYDGIPFVNAGKLKSTPIKE